MSLDGFKMFNKTFPVVEGQGNHPKINSLTSFQLSTANRLDFKAFDLVFDRNFDNFYFKRHFERKGFNITLQLFRKNARERKFLTSEGGD